MTPRINGDDADPASPPCRQPVIDDVNACEEEATNASQPGQGRCSFGRLAMCA
jgi:hypothetical protein